MLELYTPAIEELWFKAQMMGDEQTMSYNHASGGTIPFPETCWPVWHSRWIINHENKRFYRYIKVNHEFIGEVAYHLDEERQIYLANVIIHAPHRKKGYGHKALTLLCNAAKENGLLYGPFTQQLPNMTAYIDLEDPETLNDFCMPIEGFEAPYAKAQLVMYADTAVTPELPVSAEELMAFCRQYPGRVTYPALPDFTGSAFVRNIIYEICGWEQNCRTRQSHLSHPQ